MRTKQLSLASNGAVRKIRVHHDLTLTPIVWTRSGSRACIPMLAVAIPGTSSRLSDIALEWMVHAAINQRGHLQRQRDQG